MFSEIQNALSDSFSRVFTKLAVFLPGLLALILAIALFTLVGAGLAWIARRILTRLRFDQRLAHDNSAGLADWSPAHSPTLLVSRVILWACILLGVAIGVSAYDAAYGTDDMTPLVFPYLTHAVSAFLILVAGILLARYISRSVLISGANAQLQYARSLSLGVKWLVYIFTGAMVLDHLNIGGLVVELGFGILFGGIVLALALAVGLGSRDLVARSIERADKPTPIDRATTKPDPSPTLRHF